MAEPIPNKGWAAAPTTRAELLPIGAALTTAVGLDHRCVLLQGGAIRNADPSIEDSACHQRYVTRLANVEQLVMGSEFLCGRLASGGVMYWGGGPFENKPPKAPILRGAVEIAAGDTHVCAIRIDRTVWCWGEDDAGQLGDGKLDVYTAPGDYERPRPVVGLHQVRHIAAGYAHSCAIVSSGNVFCWGYNHGNQLGTGVRYDSSNFPRPHRRDDPTALGSRAYPGRVVALSQAVELALGGECSCARVSDGGVYCWGHLGYPPNSAVPTRVPGLGGVVQIVSAPNTELVCALRDTGETLCWGWNEFGVLGEDPERVTLTPQVVRW